MKIISFKHSLNYIDGVFKDAEYTIETDEQTFRMLGVTSVSDEEALIPIFKSNIPVTMEVDEPQMFVQTVTLTPEAPYLPATFTCHAIIYKPE